jgi:hypothetical protein
MEAAYSERARKAAATRAENIEKERRESARLAEETEGQYSFMTCG